jgi:hypothetical protein
MTPPSILELIYYLHEVFIFGIGLSCGLLLADGYRFMVDSLVRRLLRTPPREN